MVQIELPALKAHHRWQVKKFSASPILFQPVNVPIKVTGPAALTRLGLRSGKTKRHAETGVHMLIFIQRSCVSPLQRKEILHGSTAFLLRSQAVLAHKWLELSFRDLVWSGSQANTSVFYDHEWVPSLNFHSCPIKWKKVFLTLFFMTLGTLRPHHLVSTPVYGHTILNTPISSDLGS